MTSCPHDRNHEHIITDVIKPLSHILYLTSHSFLVKYRSHLKLLRLSRYIKSDKDKPGNYRPILLLGIFDKVLEKSVFNRMYSFLMQNDILYKYQFGFSKGFSTSLYLSTD